MCSWIRNDPNVSEDILRTWSPWLDHNVVFSQNLGEQHFNFVASEESTGASVRSHTPVELIDVVGGDKLDSHQYLNQERVPRVMRT